VRSASSLGSLLELLDDLVASLGGLLLSGSIDCALASLSSSAASAASSTSSEASTSSGEASAASSASREGLVAAVLDDLEALVILTLSNVGSGRSAASAAPASSVEPSGSSSSSSESSASSTASLPLGSLGGALSSLLDDRSLLLVLLLCLSGGGNFLLNLLGKGVLHDLNFLLSRGLDSLDGLFDWLRLGDRSLLLDGLLLDRSRLGHGGRVGNGGGGKGLIDGLGEVIAGDDILEAVGQVLESDGGVINGVFVAAHELAPVLDEAVALLPPPVGALLLALQLVEAGLEVLDALLNFVRNVLIFFEEGDEGDHVCHNANSLLLALAQLLSVALRSFLLALDGGLLGELEEVDVVLDLLDVFQNMGLGGNLLLLLLVEHEVLALGLLL